MPYIPLEQISQNADSYFKLVLSAAERANEILIGSKPLVETNSKKHTTIALREIGAGKVKYVKNPIEE